MPRQARSAIDACALRLILAVAISLLLPAASRAQAAPLETPPWRVAAKAWDTSTLGHHRAVVAVGEAASVRRACSFRSIRAAPTATTW